MGSWEPLAPWDGLSLLRWTFPTAGAFMTGEQAVSLLQLC